MFQSLTSLAVPFKPILAQSTLTANLPEGGLDVLHLALDAGLVVKSVMVVLLLASVWTWAIILSKLVILRWRNAKCSAFEQTFWSGVDLEKLYDQVKEKPDSPFTALFLSAMREWQRVQVVRPDSRVLERIDHVTQLSIGRETDRLERQLGVLASIGSTAPFVGLFGHCLGDYELLCRDCRLCQYFVGGGGSRDCRSPVCDRSGIDCRYSCDLGLQQDFRGYPAVF